MNKLLLIVSALLLWVPCCVATEEPRLDGSSLEKYKESSAAMHKYAYKISPRLSLRLTGAILAIVKNIYGQELFYGKDIDEIERMLDERFFKVIHKKTLEEVLEYAKQLPRPRGYEPGG